jgi:pimeloyl-ACP methyl ester carboxylesterase
LTKATAFLVAVVCSVGLIGATPALGTSPSTSSPRVPTLDAIQWSQCRTFLYPDLAFDSQVECGTLKVPLNYAKPKGRTITLALSLDRHTSSAQDYQGVALSNPGGPGGRGLDLGPEIASSLPHGAGGDYDWVSWDPRGVGASRPRISCMPHYFKAPRLAYAPKNKHILHYWLSRSKAFADACQKHNPALLRHMTTRDSVRDMESIRKALGVAKISFYGFSYGTYLGEVYSTLHPQHLKRMVLDSNVDPRRVWYHANLDQDRAFDRVIRRFFRWVAKYHRDYHLGTREKAVARRYHHTIKKLSRHPAHHLGPDEWADGVENAGYDQSSWPEVASAWHGFASKGHRNAMLQQYRNSDDPGDDNEYAVYNAVQCTDAKWPGSWHRWSRDNRRVNSKHPFLTWGNAWYNAPCLYWHARASKPVHINGKATKSALLVDQTLDAATPYSGSLEVRKLYPHSSLIAEPGGTTHADSLDSGSCVLDKIADYLATGQRPARQPGHGPDVRCQPPAAPRPGGDLAFNRSSPAPARLAARRD